MCSRTHQIVQNYKNAGTGQLSFIMYSLYTLGGFARVFTTLIEVHDELMLFGFFVGLAINGTIALQIIYYWYRNKIGYQKVVHEI